MKVPCDKSLGLHLARGLSRSSSGLDERDGIALANRPAVHDRTIERHPAIEFLDDAPENIAILLQRIGVESGHDAASPQLRRMHNDAPDAELTAGPLPLPQAVDAADDDIRPIGGRQCPYGKSRHP